MNVVRVIPPETTQFLVKKKFMVSDFFSVKYTSKGSIRVHNPEYQPPVTYSSRETGCTNFVN